jgi:hypothetical protein
MASSSAKVCLKTRTVPLPRNLPLRTALLQHAFSVWTQFTVQTGKRSELPKGMTLVTRMFTSSVLQAWDPMASSSADFCRKMRTVPFVCGYK